MASFMHRPAFGRDQRGDLSSRRGDRGRGSGWWRGRSARASAGRRPVRSLGPPSVAFGHGADRALGVGVEHPMQRSPLCRHRPWPAMRMALSALMRMNWFDHEGLWKMMNWVRGRGVTAPGSAPGRRRRSCAAAVSGPGPERPVEDAAARSLMHAMRAQRHLQPRSGRGAAAGADHRGSARHGHQVADAVGRQLEALGRLLAVSTTSMPRSPGQPLRA